MILDELKALREGDRVAGGREAGPAGGVVEEVNAHWLVIRWDDGPVLIAFFEESFNDPHLLGGLARLPPREPPARPWV